MRLIDADELWMDIIHSMDYCDDILEIIERQPTIDPERKTGKWIEEQRGIIVTEYRCSECGRLVRDDTGYDVAKDYPFCHCGADMRGEQDG